MDDWWREGGEGFFWIRRRNRLPGRSLTGRIVFHYVRQCIINQKAELWLDFEQVHFAFFMDVSKVSNMTFCLMPALLRLISCICRRYLAEWEKEKEPYFCVSKGRGERSAKRDYLFGQFHIVHRKPH